MDTRDGKHLHVISTPHVNLQAVRSSQQIGSLFPPSGMGMHGRNTDRDAGQQHHAHRLGGTLHPRLPGPCRHVFWVFAAALAMVLVGPRLYSGRWDLPYPENRCADATW